MSHFSVTILKSGPTPFNLPRFESRPAFILLISTSGLIRMETVFHPEMGPVLQPHWGRETLNGGGVDGSPLPIGDHCQVDWFLCHAVERLMVLDVVILAYIFSSVRVT